MAGRDILDELSVSRETREMLVDFSQELPRWSKSINLIAPSTATNIWRRHILDSAQILLAAPRDLASWCDLGSGGGLPGLVVAIILTTRPGTQITLIESDRRKAAFLKLMAVRYGLQAEVRQERIEESAPVSSQIVSARALAPLQNLLPLVVRHLHPTGMALLLKGKEADSEVELARRKWHFDVEQHASLLESQGRILAIRNIEQRADTT